MKDKNRHMKDVKLITFHKALSYGACLQAIATVLVLEQEGCQITVIDYENPYEARQRNGKFFKYSSKKEIVITLIKKLLFQNDKCKKRAFGGIRLIYPNLTAEYTELSQLDELWADIFVVGSDQVWSGKITGGLDKAFYLDFGHAQKRISFSSSMGEYTFSLKEKEYAKQAFARFTAISVREQFAKEQIKEVVKQNVHITLDPTLLISKDMWLRWACAFESNIKINGRYILAFVIAKHKINVPSIYQFYHDRLKLPVYRIMLNTHKSRGVSKVIAGPTVWEFVNLIAGASFVITDSFHGTAFSINLQIPFILLPVQGNNVRMKELLQNCGLEEREWDEKHPADVNCDFTAALRYLKDKRKEDMQWLKEALR